MNKETSLTSGSLSKKTEVSKALFCKITQAAIIRYNLLQWLTPFVVLMTLFHAILL